MRVGGFFGDGETDCHSQCAHWLRNDRGFTRGAVRRADVGIGPYGGLQGVQRAGGQRRPPLRKRILRCVGEGLCPSRGRPQGSPLRRVTRGATGGRPQGSPLRKHNKRCSGRVAREADPYGGLQEVRWFMPGRRWWGCCSRVYRHPHGGGGCGW